MPRPTETYPQGLYLIAAFKLFKGLVLLGVAIGAHRLLHRDVSAEVYRWANIFRVDADNRYVHALLARFLTLDVRKLRELSVGTFLYSGVFLTEGTGLFFRQRWAEYFTTAVTFSFIPLEIYELSIRTTLPRGLVLALNIAVVIYLMMDLGRPRSRRRLQLAGVKR